MDSSVKSACFDEISHTILDADKKLTAKTISNNWDISLKDAAAVLEEWILKNTKHNLTKEYLVKGTDQKGNGVITLVPDSKVDIIQKKLHNFSKILHSIELASEASCKKLVVPEYDDIKMVNLHLDLEEREIDITPIVPEVRVASTTNKKIELAMEKKKEVSISSMFASSSKSDNKSNKMDNDSEESKMDSSPVDRIYSSVSPKKEVRTPKKTEETNQQQQNVKESPKSKKDAKKPTPKNSIASFFIQAGNKTKSGVAAVPSASQSAKPVSPKRVKQEVKTPESIKKSEPPKKTAPVREKQSPEKVSSKSVKAELVTPKKKESKTDSLKRSISAICDSEDSDDDVIPTTPQAKKQPKTRRTKSKQNGNAKKRSRIIQNDTSDEDEHGEVKKNGKSSDIENMEVLESSTEIKSSNKIIQNGNSSSGKRRKAKRTVTRTYEDSDGFFKTVKEVEEYSCSDDNVQVEPIKSPVKQTKKNDKTTTKDAKKSPTKQTPSKKTDKHATKQGSIMSFFTKK